MNHVYVGENRSPPLTHLVWPCEVEEPQYSLPGVTTPNSLQSDISLHHHFLPFQVFCYPWASLPREKVIPMHQTSMDGVEDMSMLGDLHEAAILLNLHQRYQKDHIYVSEQTNRQTTAWKGYSCGLHFPESGGITVQQSDLSKSYQKQLIWTLPMWPCSHPDTVGVLRRNLTGTPQLLGTYLDHWSEAPGNVWTDKSSAKALPVLAVEESGVLLVGLRTMGDCCLKNKTASECKHPKVTDQSERDPVLSVLSTYCTSFLLAGNFDIRESSNNTFLPACSEV